jgi:DNA polymerase elongation subunit (family B)
VVGCLDIETTGVNETDTIFSIAFNTYKSGELQTLKRFYLFEYDNDEAKMISAFLDILSKSDIDLLVGYNIFNYDLPMIKAKEKDDRLRFTDKVNISIAYIKSELFQGYNIIVDGKLIEVIDAYFLVLKYDVINRSIPNQDHSLKSVAKHFGISKENRLVLGVDEIRKAYEERNIELLEKYQSEDVREVYEVFRKLAPPYYYIRSIIPFSLTFFDTFRLSTAAIWQKLLVYYYGSDYADKLTADEKKDFDGGLVFVNKGLYKNVFKVDVTSLYPNIMLNYHICSYKDKKKIALSLLNEYTNLRIQLKAKAKTTGDKEADLIQNSLKLLVNSLYGFYGTGGFSFNDVRASAMVTAYGRRILKEMIAYIESNNGVIVECDTDGIFYSAKNGEEIYEGLRKKLSEINLNIELEFKDCIMYASDKKNYIIIEPNSKITKKGSKYSGRDKNRLWTEFPVEYIKRYVEDPAKAEAYKQEMFDLIKSGKAYDWLKVTKKISKNETRIILDGLRKGLILEPGSIVTCAYENYRNGRFTFDTEEEKTYDVDYYVKEFQKLVGEIDGVIGR